MLGTGTGINDHARCQELRIAADKILQHGGYTNNDIARSQNRGPSEHSGEMNP